MLASQGKLRYMPLLSLIKTELIPVLFIYSWHNLGPAVSVLDTGKSTFLPSTCQDRGHKQAMHVSRNI